MSQYSTSYQLQFKNKLDLGKALNTQNASKLLRDLDKTREYGDPPLPNIQAARIAYLSQLKEQQKLSPVGSLSDLNDLNSHSMMISESPSRSISPMK